MSRPWWHLSGEAEAWGALAGGEESFDGEDGVAPDHWDPRVWTAGGRRPR